MEWVYIEDIGKYVGKEVEIRGWVYNKRSSGRIRFLLVRDGTGIIQSTAYSKEKDNPIFRAFDELTLESSVIVRGMVKEENRAPGGYELELSEIIPVQIAEDYPITPKEHGVGFLMAHRHLWLRSSKQVAIMKIRHEIIRAIRDFLDIEKKFTLIDAPILTPAACEGTTTLFETDYFGDKAYLSQSGQLYMEAAAMAHGKVYCFGPTFRAEKSKTRRHLMEFWMVEPEIAYYKLDDVIALAEEMIEFIVMRVLERRRKELERLERDINSLEKVKRPFVKISYDEAIELLKKEGFNMEWGDEIGGDEETVLSKKFEKPVIVHRFPALQKAFYMEPDPERPELSLSFDMLAPEGYGEIIGGSERISDYDLLLKRIRENKLPEDAFKWYLDLRKYGSVPHSGFGLGIERTVAWITGVKHVRETIPFPRLLYKIYP
ncbi:MAG: asparagine--tRNA ligase [Candidatus Aminicenantes bacterium]|nr:asparagine--tRNA ligase [Candidatus Aminicenantes bacterium]